MQNSKRIQNILKKLDKLEEMLSFYMNGNTEFKQDLVEIRSLIDELSLEKKEDHIRLAKKLKNVWKINTKNQES